MREKSLLSEEGGRFGPHMGGRGIVDMRMEPDCVCLGLQRLKKRCQPLRVLLVSRLPGERERSAEEAVLWQEGGVQPCA